MKPFDIEQAKAGKPVQTRDGNDVEIVRFDLRGEYPILAVIKYLKADSAITFTESGKLFKDDDSYHDLFMKSEIKEGWIAILKDKKYYFNIYTTKEKAETMGGAYPNFVAVTKIEWEE